jgi:hypothetical protein
MVPIVVRIAVPKLLIKILALVIPLSLFLPSANGEQLKRYKILYPDGSFIMNSGSSNPVVVEGYPSVYSTLVFFHDPRGIDNSVCASGCRPVLDSYQNDVQEGTPAATPSATPAPTPSATPNATPSATATQVPQRAALTSLEIELYSVSQSDFQWSINASAGGASTVLYNNFSFVWLVTGPNGEIDSGNSGTSVLAESTVGQIASFHTKNLLSGTSYIVSVIANNSGNDLRAIRTITTKNLLKVTTPSDTQTVTTPSDTQTVTTPSDTQTVANNTIQNNTGTVVTLVPKAEDPAGDLTTDEIPSVPTPKFENLNSKQKEDLLSVVYRSAKSTLITVATQTPDISLLIMATKKGAKTITFKIQTDQDGIAKVKSIKNLLGYVVTLSIGSINLDSDLVRK